MAEIKHVGQMKGSGAKAVLFIEQFRDSKSAVVIQTSKIVTRIMML